MLNYMHNYALDVAIFDVQLHMAMNDPPVHTCIYIRECTCVYAESHLHFRLTYFSTTCIWMILCKSVHACVRIGRVEERDREREGERERQ
jgi:hypothetical protein